MSWTRERYLRALEKGKKTRVGWTPKKFLKAKERQEKLEAKHAYSHSKKSKRRRL